MVPAIFKIFIILSVLALAVVIRYGYIAATESDSPRKGKAIFIASIIFSSWLCLLPFVRILYDSSLPIFEFDGKIDSIRVLDSSAKYYSAYLQIHTALGGEITVHASDRSPYFRVGQEVKIRYRGNTGELVNATFYSANGTQEGITSETSTFSNSLLILIGQFCVWASIRKYRRDPNGAEHQEDPPLSLRCE